MLSMVEGHARCFLPYLRRKTLPVPLHHPTGGPPPRAGEDRQLSVGSGSSHVPFVSSEVETPIDLAPGPMGISTRSEELRVGNVCVSQCRSLVLPNHYKKKTNSIEQ